MQCSDLIIKAAQSIGLHIYASPRNSESITTTWFKYGMGPDFKQVEGGQEGVHISELSRAIGEGAINIPLGSVIVADGHAALFNGIIKINGTWRLILYDANGTSQNWTVDHAQAGSPAVQSDDAAQFVGQSVGEHASGLQFRAGRRVKVYVAQENAQ